MTVNLSENEEPVKVPKYLTVVLLITGMISCLAIPTATSALIAFIAVNDNPTNGFVIGGLSLGIVSLFGWAACFSLSGRLALYARVETKDTVRLFLVANLLLGIVFWFWLIFLLWVGSAIADA